jgi:hypothetical protein
MKKFIWVLISTIFTSFQVCTQVVIDSSILSGYTIPFHDTTISSITASASCSPSSFLIDLNEDSSADVEFFISCNMGGLGSTFDIKVKSYVGFYIHSDTNYLEHFQYIAPGGSVIDTTRKRTVIQKYDWSDVIQGGQATLSNELPIYSYSNGNFPSCIYTNLEPVLNDTFYLVIESSNQDVYYFKLSNPSRNELRIFSVKSSVNQLPQDIIIFPNPSSGTLYFNKPYGLLEIYSIDGKLVKTQADVYETFDVSGLSNGTYWLMVHDGSTVIQTKFVKVRP